MDFSSTYEKLVDDYRADFYFKGRVFVRKKNFLIRYAPSMFKLEKGVREYLTEICGEMHYTAPNIYDQKLKRSYGTIDHFEGIGVDLLEYFHVNIYSTSLLNSKLLSPLSRTAGKHYKFTLDSLCQREEEGLLYRIAFTPKYKSYQLVEGYMLVSADVWSVRELQFSGRSEYLHFDNLVKMGEVGTDNEFLPVRYDLNATFSLLGNVVDGSFTSLFDYTSVKISEKPKRKGKRPKTNYNLTDSYTLKCDTSTFLKSDSTSFSSMRPIPLTENEISLYRDYVNRRKDTVLIAPLKTSTQLFWSEMEDIGDMLISRRTLNLSQGGSVRLSPIINPFLLTYSGRDGVSYRQELRYSRSFKGDRLLRVAPRIGYNFKYNEFYWRVHADFDYWPKKRSSLHLKVGNGNRIYSSDVLEDLKEMPDSIFDFNKVKLDYFRNLNIELMHRHEFFNGFTVDVGVAAHCRTAVEAPVIDIPEGTPPDPSLDAEIQDKIRKRYVSFAPRVKVSWSPGQYYYMHGDRKINLHSKWPTLSIDWERGIKGVFGSTGKYERMEFDLQQKRSLGKMRSISYRFGCGAFTDQEQLYFVDFVNFSKSNLPVGWNDEIGGVFQLLDRRWYNASRKYIRVHTTYESPFLLLPRLQKYTRNVLNERLYLSVLGMPHLKPYVEVGYGIGTHLFDFGIFAGSINGKKPSVGVKFTFELFNR